MAARSLLRSPRTKANTEFKLNEGQIPADALFANQLLRYICLVGGSRSGKTFFIVRAIMKRALMAQNSDHCILRFRANAAKQSIWHKTVPEVNRVCFPNVRFTEHKQDGFFAGPNGARIWVGGLDDKALVEKDLG